MHDTGTSSIVYVRYWYYQYCNITILVFLVLYSVTIIVFPVLCILYYDCIVLSWYTNTPITDVKKKRCSRLLLLRLINIDNYFAFSIFKPSSNLFVLIRKKIYIYIFFRIIWSSRPQYWYYQYYNIHNTGNTSIVTLYNTRNTSIVMLQYW
jgi:hypothetical protein